MSSIDYPLTQRQIAQYLLERKVISSKTIVQNRLYLADASRRNCNTRVVTGIEGSYLIKQGVEIDSTHTLANEAWVYELMRTSNSWKDFRKILPRYYGYDSERNILILELLSQEGEDLERYHSRGHFSILLAKAMAKALALLHSVDISESDYGQANSSRVSERPWVLSTSNVSLFDLRSMSIAAAQVLGLVQRDPGFAKAIEEAAAEWHCSALIHGDIKWANFFAYSHTKTGRKTRLKLIDWEYAAVGDPNWDVAGVFSGYLACWVTGMPVSAANPPADWQKFCRFPLNRMQPAIKAFWNKYCETRQLRGAERNEYLWRSIFYSGIRLIQTAIEQSQTSTSMTGNGACLLQLSRNIFESPHLAAVYLLGLSLR